MKPGLLAALAVLSLLLTACNRPPEVWRFEGKTMGSSYHVTVVAPPQGLDEAALGRDIAALLGDLNARLTTYQDTSEISRFNASAPGEWFAVSPVVFGIMQEAERTYRLSGGAFDVTVAPLIRLWGFGAGPVEDRVPSDAEIAAARASVGFERIGMRAQPPALRRAPGVTVDPSALGDGYAADAVAALLHTRGVGHYLVDIAGEMVARGHSPRGDAWRVAIETPDAMPGTVYEAVELAGGGAVSTSGDYRNYFEKDGVRYSHTIDPATGRPIVHRLASVTVIDASAARADALSTAFMVMGPERAREWAQRNGVPCLFIVRGREGFESFHTAGFADYLKEGN